MVDGTDMKGYNVVDDVFEIPMSADEVNTII